MNVKSVIWEEFYFGARMLSHQMCSCDVVREITARIEGCINTCYDLELITFKERQEYIIVLGELKQEALSATYDADKEKAKRILGMNIVATAKTLYYTEPEKETIYKMVKHLEGMEHMMYNLCNISDDEEEFYVELIDSIRKEAIDNCY